MVKNGHHEDANTNLNNIAARNGDRVSDNDMRAMELTAQVAQAQATLAVAWELRALREHLENRA